MAERRGETGHVIGWTEDASRVDGTRRGGRDTQMVMTRLLTAEELAALPDDGFEYELVRGELRRMPPPTPEHGQVCKRIARHLILYEDLGLATVIINDAGVWLERDPDTVRGPDIAVYLNDLLPPRPWTSYFTTPPTLVVEARSPSEDLSSVEEKIGDYKRAGVPLIVYAFPETRTVWVDGTGRERVVLAENDVLDGSDVLPGLPRIPVADIFR
jgi:Uma2 family endonuclease